MDKTLTTCLTRILWSKAKSLKSPKFEETNPRSPKPRRPNGALEGEEGIEWATRRLSSLKVPSSKIKIGQRKGSSNWLNSWESHTSRHTNGFGTERRRSWTRLSAIMIVMSFDKFNWADLTKITPDWLCLIKASWERFNRDFAFAPY